MILPKKYEIYDTTPEKYHKYKGWNKLSYSQYTSFKDPLYKQDYIIQYFLGVKLDSGIFASYGGAVGFYLSDGVRDENLLSEEDCKVLDSIERPPHAVYEGEIFVDRGSYGIQGFIDIEYEDEGGLVIEDFKSGNADKKVEFYGGQEYQQTTLYSYQRENEGHHIKYSGVQLIGRKGNGRPGHPLRLSGVVIPIPTPYSKERAEKALADMDKIAEEISDLYKIFLKVNI